jgi:hypothetical protein
MSGVLPFRNLRFNGCFDKDKQRSKNSVIHSLEEALFDRWSPHMSGGFQSCSNLQQPKKMESVAWCSCVKLVENGRSCAALSALQQGIKPTAYWGTAEIAIQMISNDHCSKWTHIIYIYKYIYIYIFSIYTYIQKNSNWSIYIYINIHTITHFCLRSVRGL